jgi:Carboxypeptidase regulatory-like domain
MKPMRRAGIFAVTLLALLGILVKPAQAQLNIVTGSGTDAPRPNGPYQIRGRVVNGQTGQAIARAEVSISLSGQMGEEGFEFVESNEDGGFHFDHLAQGKYSLNASRQGFAPQSYLQHETFLSGVAVGPGKDSIHVRFTLYPSASISGQVLDENGDGVRGAEIMVWKESLEDGRVKVNQVGQSQTDDEGRYRLEHLGPGKYTASVFAMPWYSRNSPLGHATIVENEGQDSEALTSGGAGRGNSAAAFTVHKGTVNEGSGLLDVVYPTTFYPTGRDIHAASWFTLHDGDDETADFHLQPIPGIRVQILTGKSEGSGAGTVRLLQEISEQGSDNVGILRREIAPGIVEISGLAPGRYQLEAMGAFADEHGRHRLQEVELDGDTQIDLDVETSSGPKISGELRYSQPKAPSTFTNLRLKDMQGKDYWTQSMPPERKKDSSEAPDGSAAEPVVTSERFAFTNLPAGAAAYDFSVVTPPGTRIESIQATGASVAGHKITTDGPSEVHLVVRVTQFNLAIEGIAVQAGKPFAGAMMLLLPESGDEESVRRDQSDSDGTFHLDGIAPGKYRLMALEHGWELEWMKPEIRQSLMTKGVETEVKEAAPRPLQVEVE